MVNFSNATDNLEEQLVDDGHFVVRCEHSYGHQVPMNALDIGWDWIEAHRFGEPSPIQAAGLSGSEWTDWCEVVD